MGIITKPTEPRAMAPVVRFARLDSLGRDDDDDDEEEEEVVVDTFLLSVLLEMTPLGVVDRG